MEFYYESGLSQELFSLQGGKVEACKEKQTKVMWKLPSFMDWSRSYQKHVTRGVFACLEVKIKKAVVQEYCSSTEYSSRWKDLKNSGVNPIGAAGGRGLGSCFV